MVFDFLDYVVFSIYFATLWLLIAFRIYQLYLHNNESEILP